MAPFILRMGGPFQFDRSRQEWVAPFIGSRQEWVAPFIGPSRPGPLPDRPMTTGGARRALAELSKNKHQDRASVSTVGSLDLADLDRMRQRSILMPLRDHFRPPVWNQASWEGFHGGWPMMMVLNLAPKLPKGFAAEPRVHLGTYFEIDVCTFDKDGERDWHSDPDPVTRWRRGHGHPGAARTDAHRRCRFPGSVCLRSPDL